MLRNLFLLLMSAAVCAGCSTAHKALVYNEIPGSNSSLEIHEGILCPGAQKIKYKRGGKTLAVIELSEPVMVAQAEREERWGWFQFPSIGKAADGTLIVKWHMQEDSHRSYGTISKQPAVPMMSKDGGLTWQPQDRDYFAPPKLYNGTLRDGRVLQISTPKALDVKSFTDFPEPVATKGKNSYYLVDSLPAVFQGAYLQFIGEGLQPESIHAEVHDPGALRYTIDGSMPVVWWGDIKELSDGSLVAGVYPCHYLDEDGGLARGSVSFYRSCDGAKHWEVLAHIPCIADGILDKRGDGRFDEPAFEVLPDSTFLCVMRTGSPSPMYRTFSSDRGKTWTAPEPFTPNGVDPMLMLLKNGVVVLASGRPGLQLRFSLDGSGRDWTEPLDMIPFMNPDGTYVKNVSCGYPSIVENDDESFFVAYSDFTTKNDAGQTRKAIFVRKVIVTLKR